MSCCVLSGCTATYPSDLLSVGIIVLIILFPTMLISGQSRCCLWNSEVSHDHCNKPTLTNILPKWFFCCCWVNITTNMSCNRIDWWKGCLESRAACLLMLRDFARNCWCSGYQTSYYGNVNWKSKVMQVNWQFHNNGGYEITILISAWTWGYVTVCWLRQ